uniref:ABC-2 type transporter transmembrane domain-containing protein n=1 Tax=Podarcis muralis TaxID=64176 RepID=A0A670I278_PODMU
MLPLLPYFYSIPPQLHQRLLLPPWIVPVPSRGWYVLCTEVLTLAQQGDTVDSYANKGSKVTFSDWIVLENCYSYIVLELYISRLTEPFSSVLSWPVNKQELFEESLRRLISHNLTFLATVLCFSPFLYFLSQNVSGEKRKLKEMMKTMGLRDTAFWLSWGLLYAVYIAILSCLLAFPLMISYLTASTFPAVFLLLFLYGISCICFCFMVSSLLKKPKTTSFVVFFLMFTLGAISIVLLINLVPAALKWTLSVFCPFAFGVELNLYTVNAQVANVIHAGCMFAIRSVHNPRGLRFSASAHAQSVI